MRREGGGSLKCTLGPLRPAFPFRPAGGWHRPWPPASLHQHRPWGRSPLLLSGLCKSGSCAQTGSQSAFSLCLGKISLQSTYLQKCNENKNALSKSKARLWELRLPDTIRPRQPHSFAKAYNFANTRSLEEEEEKKNTFKPHLSSPRTVAWKPVLPYLCCRWTSITNTSL